jgi:hypothetical protein
LKRLLSAVAPLQVSDTTLVAFLLASHPYGWELEAHVRDGVVEDGAVPGSGDENGESTLVCLDGPVSWELWREAPARSGQITRENLNQAEMEKAEEEEEEC